MLMIELYICTGTGDLSQVWLYWLDIVVFLIPGIIIL
jgi:hypothetical protein